MFVLGGAGLRSHLGDWDLTVDSVRQVNSGVLPGIRLHPLRFVVRCHATFRCYVVGAADGMHKAAIDVFV